MKPELVVLGMLLLPACHPQDIDPLEQQPKFKPYQENDFFADRRSMRTPPEGTIAREHDFGDPPTAVTAEMLELGRAKYNATCGACHGLAGDGQSVVAHKLNLRAPPTLQDERLRNVTPDYLYQVISEGYGIMPRYSTALQPRERWAVVAYVRALQLSQHVPAGELSSEVRANVESGLSLLPKEPIHKPAHHGGGHEEKPQHEENEK